MADSFSIEVGDSFEINNQYGKHLHFVIAEESAKDHSLIILVYISSANTVYKDTTTIIKPGEHPYITDTIVCQFFCKISHRSFHYLNNILATLHIQINSAKFPFFTEFHQNS